MDVIKRGTDAGHDQPSGKREWKSYYQEQETTCQTQGGEAKHAYRYGPANLKVERDTGITKVYELEERKKKTLKAAMKAGNWKRRGQKPLFGKRKLSQK